MAQTSPVTEVSHRRDPSIIESAASCAESLSSQHQHFSVPSLDLRSESQGLPIASEVGRLLSEMLGCRYAGFGWEGSGGIIKVDAKSLPDRATVTVLIHEGDQPDE